MQFKSSPSIGGGSKNFLKLKDKESVVGVFRGMPHEFYVVWKDNKSHIVDESTPKASFRFRINFVLSENGVYVAKVFEQGATVYNLLKELHEECDLEKAIVKITRSGTGTNTTYSIIPSMKQKLTKEMSAQIDAVALQPLEHGKRDDETPEGKLNPFDSDEEIPF